MVVCGAVSNSSLRLSPAAGAAVEFGPGALAAAALQRTSGVGGAARVGRDAVVDALSVVVGLR